MRSIHEDIKSLEREILLLKERQKQNYLKDRETKILFLEKGVEKLKNIWNRS